IESEANRRIGHARRETSVQCAMAVEQLGPYTALDGNAVAMQTYELESQQMIEGLPAKKVLEQFYAALGVAQVS
ncbi:MAG TPA: hypothetical protein VKE70_33350, partial [Candidatus Solibacter sp.]|nr:hypothetical protein [Candidatus Solibacter sp.]